MNILTAALLILCSCGYLGGMFGEGPEPPSAESAEPLGSEPQAEPPARVAIEDLAESRARTVSDIELIWEIPEEQVEGYVISYGENESELTKQVRVRSESLEKVEDARHGTVYRYVLSGIPLKQTVYVAIAAYSGEEQSPASKIIKVPGRDS